MSKEYRSVYTSESTTFFKRYFDKDLWEVIWGHVKEIYDVEEPRKPQRLHCDIAMLKRKLQEYCNNNVHFICELPSMKGQFNEQIQPTIIKNPYTCPIEIASQKIDVCQIQQDIVDCYNKSQHIVNDSHKLG